MNTAQLRQQRSSSAVAALQLSIEQSGMLRIGGLLNLMTGTGKTYLSRKAAAAVVAAGGRVIYVCPLRSLAREVAAEWAAAPELNGAPVGLFTGEAGADDGSEIVSPRDAQLLVMTAEKLDAYLRTWHRHADWLAQVDLLVVDELHTLGDGSRGAALDGIITRFRQINPYAAILGLTATMGNVAEVANWLGVQYISSRLRWVPLRWRVATFRAGQGGMANRAALVAKEVSQTASEGGQTLVFVQSRLRAEQLAGRLEKDGIRARPHHAGMASDEREAVEEGLRAGKLQCVVATGTLSMGLNLPVRKCVIHDLSRFESGRAVPLTTVETWQLAGRAGRKGLDESGEVVLIAGQHEAGQAWGYSKGVFERVVSPMHAPAAMAGQVLAMVGSRVATSAGQLTRVMGKTLAGAQDEAFTRGVGPCLEEMVQAGMLVYKGEDLAATRVGFAAVRHMISPATANAWLKAVELGADEFSFMDILVLASSVPECGLKLRLRKDQLATIGSAMRHEPMWLRQQTPDQWVVMTGQEEGNRLLLSLLAAGVMRAWSRLGAMPAAASALGLSAADVEDVRREVLRTLAAFKDVVAASAGRRKRSGKTLACDPKLGEKIRAVIAMTTCGLNARQATLSLVEGIGPTFARKLVDHGLGDITELAGTSLQKLMEVEGVAERRATTWIERAKALHECGGAYRYKQADEWAATIIEPDTKHDRDLLKQLWALEKEQQTS